MSGIFCSICCAPWAIDPIYPRPAIDGIYFAAVCPIYFIVDEDGMYLAIVDPI